MIQEEKIVEYINSDLFTIDGEYTNETVYDAVRFGYGLCNSEWEEKTRWIPVEEELPEEDGFYLVISPNQFPKNCKIVIAEFYTYNKTFYCECFELPIKNATHWRPIEMK